MEGEMDVGLAPPLFLQQSQLFSAPAMARKRDLSWACPGVLPNVHQQQQSQRWLMGSGLDLSGDSSSWNPRMWDWDSVRFTAKPSAGECNDAEQRRDDGRKALVQESENLSLKLGGGSYAVEEPVVRPFKRVRSGSPSNAVTYPMCQVDDCKADLSNAKDYHRRHKVCELHSKTSNALVCKQMQRFCQQCSRFHPLMEFDEGKRSCRRRLAGHNRRRRKTQPEDARSSILVPRSQDGKTNGSMDIVNLLAILTRLQGYSTEKHAVMSSPLDKDRLIFLLNKISSSQSANVSSKSNAQGVFDINVSQTPQQHAQEEPIKEIGNRSVPSTMDLLAVLSAALASSKPNALANIKCCEKPAQIATPRFPLQLFGSEDDSPPKLGYENKYPSSESSNPIEDRSPSCSPPMEKKLFPLHSASEKKYEGMLISREDHATAEMSTTSGWVTPLELFMNSSSFGSDRSPSTSTCEAQDQTGQIIFKLFDKDPSNFPGTLRAEVLSWLSHRPSEIESYIRPGCVVLTVYLCMTSTAWDELEKEFLQRVCSLVRCSVSGFWRSGRFLVRIGRQLASHKDGKIHVCNSWKTLGSPELTSVSPIAIVSGKAASLVLKGRNLTAPGTKIHCTYKGGYSSKEVLGLTYPGTIYDHSSCQSFIFPKELPFAYGRLFVEVENGFKGNSFPIIIADAAICQELRTLESELEDVGGMDAISHYQYQEKGRPESREDALYFLNELGWLFQRKNHYPDPSFTDFSTSRFEYLFTFSVERDWSALARMLLDMLVERAYSSDSILEESLEMLVDLQLLTRALKRKCRKMVELLLGYSIKNNLTKDSEVYLFTPNSICPGGLTPLHLAASMQDAEEMVDALTSDPQEIGLNCWDCLMDNGGWSPSMYATSRNNHSYNKLIARKLADKKNGQVSVVIWHEEIPMDKPFVAAESPGCPSAMSLSSCAQCALANSRLAMVNCSRRLLHRPYVHSVLAIAAVCVCVCLFLRGPPWVGSVAPFEWKNLEFGPK
ncbi:Squamosa promoter-binding-like protein 15 [Apostasia shenzhenica]|uniref:Squamosa promoter-binding-like protein 15 n=1 Tax=Apostasia shenzhenica TaxID=1088818 RepID=A0A2H9ZVP3_9ASPA|nr:Squamosa promoter-binding-like protein 15 [Apostasia shenzhenica]